MSCVDPFNRIGFCRMKGSLVVISRFLVVSNIHRTERIILVENASFSDRISHIFKTTLLFAW
jgi:hypothetical protein